MARMITEWIETRAKHKNTGDLQDRMTFPSRRLCRVFVSSGSRSSHLDTPTVWGHTKLAARQPGRATARPRACYPGRVSAHGIITKELPSPNAHPNIRNKQCPNRHLLIKGKIYFTREPLTGHLHRRDYSQHLPDSNTN